MWPVREANPTEGPQEPSLLLPGPGTLWGGSRPGNWSGAWLPGRVSRRDATEDESLEAEVRMAAETEPKKVTVGWAPGGKLPVGCTTV